MPRIPTRIPRTLAVGVALGLLPPLASEPVRAGVRQLVESRSVQVLTPREVLQILLAGEGPVVVDCRHPKKYAEGHIPGAVNVFHKDTWGRIAQLRRWDRERGIVYYDKKGVQSKIASAAAIKEGLRRVGVMEGHFAEWVRLGYPVAVGPDE